MALREKVREGSPAEIGKPVDYLIKLLAQGMSLIEQT